MQKGLLSDYFEGVGVKRLSAVEVDPARSNQHEYAGEHLRKMFGDDDRLNIPARFIWLSDEQEAIAEDSQVSWYDSRRAQLHRGPEYRLYYYKNSVTDMMKEGDFFFVALRADGSAMIFITPGGSTIQSQLIWLFDLDDPQQNAFEVKDVPDDAQLDFAARYVLDEIGIEAEGPEAETLDSIIDKYGMTFPTTAVFAKMARDSLPDVSAKDDADLALSSWVEREANLFKRLERRIVSERLEAGFMADGAADVESFIDFSLSVQNRRKSRAGHSLELHIEALLKARDIKYERQPVTEGKSRPDFLFPGGKEYRDTTFKIEKLTMLGSKSTLKDRWRQVLDEADRITHKHLLTLEPSISASQTDAMKNRNLQLVLPQSVHESFTPAQQKWLMNVSGFIDLVSSRQKL